MNQLLYHVVRRRGEPQGTQTTIFLDAVPIGNGWCAKGLSLAVGQRPDDTAVLIVDRWECGREASPDDPDDIETDDIERAVLAAILGRR